MAINISSPNPIRFSDITKEFGQPPGKNLGAFRVSRTVGGLDNLALDNQTSGTSITPLIPQSGPIKFSDFYGTRLNVVVDFYSPNVNNTTRKDARTRYNEINNTGVTVILPTGAIKTKPSGGTGTKIWIHVNQTIGSLKGDRNYVALKTGSWDGTAQIITHVGPAGKLIGSGGNGGPGRTGTGGNGTTGTSALGVQYSTTIINQGLIFGGRGGGGGGGGATALSCGKNQRGCKGGSTIILTGGGGAGGRGFPGGTGGTGENPGTSGTVNLNGSPGGSQSNDGSSAGYPGTSGAGGPIESSGGSGSPGSGGGSGGSRGYAIIVSPGVSIIDYSGNPLEGDQLNGGIVL
jgi:hypothetical protein